ncbi:IclR family transcriptional regulator [Caballeronia sp. LZ019]|uniref:IclR family transcriptional regulator n=1 Tax=Caballeronia sp. LZ019 TaxID=3038555 RepID=UPI00285CEB0F|nr:MULTISPECIES: IclR family transcriptional regulator [unclassified Caballeronia]MDR5741105.1 IclR family transcriptional regulator [Caballeronia sp. LZ016]MDR5807005.1 IclR family transcriptional regulator [Caballeronia sp. LZ019]
MKEAAEKSQRGIQSVEVAGRILQALAKRRTAAPLSELASAAALSTAQAHTYLVSLTRLGLVKRDALTGYYEPGPLSLRLGLIFVEQQQAYRVAAPYAASLAEKLGFSVAVCVAGAQGPMIVRYERGAYPLHVNLHIGTVMSLSTTSTGRVFSAFLRPDRFAAMMESQGIARLNLGFDDAESSDSAKTESLDKVRKRGMARSVDSPSPGISSLSVPVFDADGSMQLALTVIGPSGAMDVAWNGQIATELQDASRRITDYLTESASIHAD